MDLQDLQLALPSSNDLNSSYTFASPRLQHFSLPYPMIKYIFTNPSSGKAWKKLIKTCKYFFSKIPIYPVECLQHGYGNEWKADGEIFDSMKNIAKLWIYDQINVYDLKPTVLSSLIPKIVKCDLRSLDILLQHLTYDEYQFLTSAGNLKELELCDYTIKHSDGTLVTVDQLFLNIHKLERFVMYYGSNSSSMFKTDTFKKLAEILPGLKQLSRFNLIRLTEEFDFASITDFILKNEKLLIKLDYNKRIALSDAYKEILESFIAKIIETPPKRIPIIDFLGFQNSVYYNDYQKLYKERK